MKKYEVIVEKADGTTVTIVVRGYNTQDARQNVTEGKVISVSRL